MEEKNFKKSQTSLDEEQILSFWQKENIFQLSLNKNKKDYIFYDGPPFATGLPHHGHILAGTIKDVIPRYKTMKGFHVPRVWGWDCHGLPIEEKVEKNLGISGREAIEKYGIGNFNEKAREQIFTYRDSWKKIIPRTGRFVDMDKDYKTMDPSFMLSVWNIFKKIHKKGLVYEGFKPMHICPRCETTLSNNEVSEGYKDLKDLSAVVKFKLTDEKNTFFLAWTTTPWTLPANTALAVGENLEYQKISLKDEDGENFYILAKQRVEEIFKNRKEISVIENFKGSDLVGKNYEPVFPYYFQNKDLENRENGWKVYGASFVSSDSGTGIVHIAPAFGADDLNLSLEKKIPFIQHISMSGKFKKEVTDFPEINGMIKTKDDNISTDIEIIKYLAKNNFLFSKEKIEHSYPTCWRCETPLLNFATSSWFISTQEVRKKMVELNKKINWVPKNLGEKRFHNWIKEGPDWAFSRTRYWGTPVPIWKSEKGDVDVLGSIKDIKEKTRSKNNFIIIRHGESLSNIKKVVSSTAGDLNDDLTEKGEKQAREAGNKVKKILNTEVKNNNGEKIDLIISSPFVRTRKTAENLAKSFSIKPEEIIFEEKLKEREFGVFDGKDLQNYWDHIGNSWTEESLLEKIPGGESTVDVKKRMMEALYEIDEKYSGKNILIVTHFSVVWNAIFGADGLSVKQSYEKRKNWGVPKNAFPFFLDFAKIPHDENFELDLHRPYVDKISWKNENGEQMRFCELIFDCWFESGSMPYGSAGYPFSENNFSPEKNVGFPAEFIAEGADQTRGWFNSLLTISSLVYGKTAFKNVVVNGMIMAEDGKKMSKSKENFTPPEEIIDKYGADAMRLYMLSLPLVKGENVSFLDSGVDEILKKNILRLKNVLTIYELYKEISYKNVDPRKSKNILDIWIIERFYRILEEVEEGLENFELDRAVRPLFAFIDDFSTWYIRRSRDRFKNDENSEDKAFALETTKFILKNFSKTIAPFAPFVSDFIWQKIKNKNDEKSVHLEDWPKNKNSSFQKVFRSVYGSSGGVVLSEMDGLRAIVSKALEVRSENKAKVRQPLASISISGKGVNFLKKHNFFQILEEELNVKKVLVQEIKNQEIKIDFDFNLTDDLKKEGEFRDFLRLVQAERKNLGLFPDEDIKIFISKEKKDFLENFEDEFKKTAGVEILEYKENFPEDFEIEKI